MPGSELHARFWGRLHRPLSPARRRGRPSLKLDAKCGQRRPHCCDAHPLAPFGLQPLDQLGESSVRTFCQMRNDGLQVTVELAAGTPALRQRRGDASQLPSRERLVNVGNADLEQWRDLMDLPAAVHRRQHPCPQILRIGLPRSPHHVCPPPQKTTGRNHYLCRFGNLFLFPVGLNFVPIRLKNYSTQPFSTFRQPCTEGGQLEFYLRWTLPGIGLRHTQETLVTIVSMDHQSRVKPQPSPPVLDPRRGHHSIADWTRRGK
jgi:hypothetical protein